MTPQAMTWVRDNVIFALNCDETPQKGQLEAFEGFARLNTKQYGRHRERNLKIGNRWYSRDTDPVYVVHTAPGKSPRALISPEAYRTTSWRRAINSLEDYQRAWLLYCYSLRGNYIHHMLVCEYVYLQLLDRLKGKRVSHGMTANLILIANLAVWNSALLIKPDSGRSLYAPTYAAQIIGVSASAWCQGYKRHWRFMHDICADLDRDALEKLAIKI
ncbi:hypothetical protein M8A54_000377 [Salmonella enterica]|nr:hypothetical protein [Salmonella enterica]